MLVAFPMIARAQQALLLVPQPRDARVERDVVLSRGVDVVIPADSADAFTAREMRDALREAGVLVANGSGSARIVLLRSATPAARALLERAHTSLGQEMRDEGYLLVPSGTTLNIIAATASGIFYGAQTVKQLVIGRGASAILRMASVRDWPAMRYRGLHDDLSRGPVPTLDYMKRQLRSFDATR